MVYFYCFFKKFRTVSEFVTHLLLQIEPIVSGNLPPGFDSSIGPVEGCKLIRKEKVELVPFQTKLTEDLFFWL